MARKSRAKQKANQANSIIVPGKGPTESQAKKVRLVDEVMGIEEMVLEDDDEEPMDYQPEILSPRSSLRSLQQQTMLRENFSDWLETIQKSGEKISQEQSRRIEGNIEPVPILFSPENENPNIVKIEMEDVQLEIDLWSLVVVYCYVIGANPPIHVMEGYFRRIWRNSGIDKIAMVKKGIYVVGFTTMEKRDNVLAGNGLFFDSKPVVVKPWSADIDICKDDIRVLPIWIQLKLDFKYWGESCLGKIVQPIGRMIKIDQATSKKDKLQFARIMVEVSIGQAFPEKLHFINELNNMVEVIVHYEWKPLQCTAYKNMGHEASRCEKPIVRKEWRQKVQGQGAEGQVRNTTRASQPVVFQTVKNPVRRSLASNDVAPTHNTFVVLDEVEEDTGGEPPDTSRHKEVLTGEDVMVGMVECGAGGKVSGGSKPPEDHG